MAKPIFCVEPIKLMQGFSAKMKHNYRLGNVPNADKDLTKNNRSIIDMPDGDTYLSFFEKKISNLPYYDTHKIRKDNTIGYEILLSYSLKNFPDNFSLEEWVNTSKQWLIDEFGKDNIASAVLHMDEGTPHIHAVMIPIVDGRLAGSKIFSRSSMREMHDRYYDRVKDLGFERTNGYKLISHEKTGVFYKNIDLALEKELPGPNEGETLDEYAIRANEFYKNQMVRNLTKDHQIEELKKTNEALERANNYILSEIGSVEKAKKAIKYHDGMMNCFKYLTEVDKDRAEKLLDQLKEAKLEYENYMTEKER